MELFSDYVPPTFEDIQQNPALLPVLDRCYAQGFAADTAKVRFCDVTAAMFCLLQVLTGSNWHIILYRAQEVTSFYHVWYFVAFFVFAVILLIKLMTAAYIDAFSAERNATGNGKNLKNLMILMNHEHLLQNPEFVDAGKIQVSVVHSLRRWKRNLGKKGDEGEGADHHHHEDDAPPSPLSKGITPTDTVPPTI